MKSSATPFIVAGLAAGAAYLLLRKGDSETGNGSDGLGGSGDVPSRAPPNLGLCDTSIAAWNDKQRAKVMKVTLEEIGRAGSNWNGMAELNEKTFQIVRAITVILCPGWSVPESLYQLPNYLEAGSPAMRQWWEHMEIGIRDRLGGWVT